MILFEGNLLSNDSLDMVLGKLWDSCLVTIQNREDISGRVISACERVAENLKAGYYDSIVFPLIEKGVVTKAQITEVIKLFSRKNLELKYNIELGNYKTEISADRDVNRIKKVEPLGILFHIAAGNAEGLPFYSVLEGMLSGNVNILKLPSMDDGISVLLLYELIKEEPTLASYVCVLDVPSANLEIMKKIADMADGIVIWGGDEAIRAIRTYTAPNTQIISWGHKLSFAYVTEDVLTEDEKRQELYALAHHMCETKQILCSSCQGIYVDSSDSEIIETVGKIFFDILSEVSLMYPPETLGIRGKLSITLYNEELENQAGTKSIYRGNGASVIVSLDSRLELSHMFKNCWVKPLPRKLIVTNMKENKGYLQTVGLICKEADRAELVEEFIKAGVVRITNAGNMSTMYPGETHDGEYPLRRYSRIVEIIE